MRVRRRLLSRVLLLTLAWASVLSPDAEQRLTNARPTSGQRPVCPGLVNRYPKGPQTAAFGGGRRTVKERNPLERPGLVDRYNPMTP